MAKEHRPNTSTPPDEESVFSRLMNTRVAQTDREPAEQVAACLVFRRGMTTDDANRILNALTVWFESTEVQAFNPAYGRPVLWYA